MRALTLSTTLLSLAALVAALAACGTSTRTTSSPDAGGSRSGDAAVPAQDTAGGPDEGSRGTDGDSGTEPDDGQPPGDAGGDDGIDGTTPGNTSPTFDDPPPVTLEPGQSKEVDLAPYIGDAEDDDSALAVGCSAEHLEVSVSDGHVLTVAAPASFEGTEHVALNVTDTQGAVATASLQVTVQSGTPPPDCNVVTFSYDAPAGTGEVLLSGSFNGWGSTSATADPLADADGDGTWEVTLTLSPGTYEYKFIVDGSWLADPKNPKKKADGLGGFNSVLTVCAAPPPVIACGKVVLKYVDADAKEVLVSGSFNGWASTAGSAGVMVGEGAGTWSITLDLAPGTYQYKLIVDGAWIADPSNPDTTDDGMGGVNSVLVVPECTSGTLVLKSHDVTGSAFGAVLGAADGSALDPAGLTVTVDFAPAGGAVTGNDDGTVSLELDGLATGIHDVRVESGSDEMLLKVYVGVDKSWKGVTIYFAMTDRFLNGDPENDAPVPDVPWQTNYQGGDFAGIAKKVEDGYFTDLGVGAIWLSWPVDNADGYEDGGFPDQEGCGLSPKTAKYSPTRYTAYHGYWPADLKKTESAFGTIDELRDLVKKAHAKGIRIMLDFTANHVHDQSFFYEENKDKGFFNFPAEICEDVGWDTKPKTCWFVSYLPDLNYNNANARKAVVDHAIEWVYSTGADGFRFDAVKHLEMSFIQELRARTKAELEHTGVDFYIVGETFTGDTGLIQSFVGGDKIHGQFDFPSNLVILQGFAKEEKGLSDMDNAVRSYKDTYLGGEMMSTFIGNHDIARFISHASGQIVCGIWDVVSNIAQGWKNPPPEPGDDVPYRKLELAFTYAMTIPGLPLIYYGDELGMPGAGDPDNRRMMKFGTALNEREKTTLAYMKKLGQARMQHVVLRKGAWSGQLWAEKDFLAYARTAAEEKAVILINRGSGDKVGSLSVGSLLSDGTKLNDVVGDGGAKTVSGGKLELSVPGRRAQVFVTE